MMHPVVAHHAMHHVMMMMMGHPVHHHVAIVVHHHGARLGGRDRRGESGGHDGAGGDQAFRCHASSPSADHPSRNDLGDRSGQATKAARNGFRKSAGAPTSGAVSAPGPECASRDPSTTDSNPEQAFSALGLEQKRGTTYHMFIDFLAGLISLLSRSTVHG